MTRTKNPAEESKRHIAAKAKELFCQKGYFLTSMEDIRQHTGMSKGNIYYHFKSKEALFLYVLELSMEEWAQKWQEKSASLKTATEKLYALAEHFALDFENPLMKASDEFSGSQSSNPEIRAKLVEMTGMYYPILLKILEEGIRNQEFKCLDSNELSYIVFGLMGGLGSVCYLFNAYEMAAIYRKSIDILLKGIQKD